MEVVEVMEFGEDGEGFGEAVGDLLVGVFVVGFEAEAERGCGVGGSDVGPAVVEADACAVGAVDGEASVVLVGDGVGDVGFALVGAGEAEFWGDGSGSDVVEGVGEGGVFAGEVVGEGEGGVDAVVEPGVMFVG